MRLYRIAVFGKAGESQGFKWARNAESARRIMKEQRAAGYIIAQMNSVILPPGKDALVQFLNEWANHPDNGAP